MFDRSSVAFALGENSRRSRFELRMEGFNTWNHTEFNWVSNNFGSSNFGRVVSDFDPRVFQLGGSVTYCK
jgi:hypothetical protein